MKIICKSTRVLELTANRNDGAMRDVLVRYLSPLPHFGSSPSEPPLALSPSSKHHSSIQRATQEYDDWKSTTEQTLSASGGCFTVRVTLALFHISSRFTLLPKFSPLSLRPGVAGVCFEVPSGESLCLNGLCHVFRGSWRGGSLVSAWYFVASLTRGYGLVVLMFVFCCFAVPMR